MKGIRHWACRLPFPNLQKGPPPLRLLCCKCPLVALLTDEEMPELSQMMGSWDLACAANSGGGAALGALFGKWGGQSG